MPRERAREGLPVESLIRDAAMFAAAGAAQWLCPVKRRTPRTEAEWKARHATEEKVFPVIEEMTRTLVEGDMPATFESPARKNQGMHPSRRLVRQKLRRAAEGFGGQHATKP